MALSHTWHSVTLGTRSYLALGPLGTRSHLALGQLGTRSHLALGPLGTRSHGTRSTWHSVHLAIGPLGTLSLGTQSVGIHILLQLPYHIPLHALHPQITLTTQKYRLFIPYQLYTDMSKIDFPVFCFQRRFTFIGLGRCNNVQTKRSIVEYGNWPKLQI